jgi:ABC-type transport system substrate-binding protein
METGLMRIRLFLILTPVVVSCLLLSSYFWVPTYAEQAQENPQRLDAYITATIGDASILNPVLSADSGSSQINAMVFEGLIDRDEELRHRGRVAKSWTITEEAWFCIPPAGGGPSDSRAAVALIDRLRRERPDLSAIVGAEPVPPGRRNLIHLEKTADGGQTKVAVTVDVPQRVKLTLNKVDMDLFTKLEADFGKGYFDRFRPEAHVTTDPPLPDDRLRQLAPGWLPGTEHNPIIAFRLRSGVQFQDGHPVDAGDVKFTYNAIMNPKNLSPRIPDYEPVKRVEVVDPLTVNIVYKRLYSPALGTWGMGLLPEHLLSDEALAAEARRLGKPPEGFTMRDSGFNRSPVGCGPYRFVEWKSDQYIRLARFEQYWEGPPNYESYVLRIIPDLLTQEMEFYAGTLDHYQVQPHQVARLKSDSRFQSFSGTAFGYTYIGYNLRREPFNDRRVRTALGMAIDTRKIIDYVLYNQAERITGPFAKQTEFYSPDIAPLPHDPQGALALLAEAGWKRNDDGWLERDGRRLQFTLITNNGNDLRKAIMAIAQDAWKKIGVDVRTGLVEWSVFIQKRINQLDFDAVILGWSLGIDPDLYQLWHSSQTGPFQLNFVGFANPEADDLIVRIRQEYDIDRQVAACHRLHRIIAAEQPYTFLYVGKSTAVLDRRIVLKTEASDGTVQYAPIRPTKTGNYAFHFNRWVKLPEFPTFNDRG